MTITGASEIIPGLFRDKGGAGFNVKHPDFGALGDGRTVADAAITTGTAILTSATAAFTSADVGKLILVGNASTLAGTGTVTAAAGAVTFSTSQLAYLQGDPLVTGAIIKVGATEYTLLTFDGTTTGTVSGAPTFVASAFTIVIRLSTTIAGYTNATTVTLTANAGRTTSGATIYYGTDDYAAITAAISGTTTGAELIWPAGIYMTSAGIASNKKMKWRGTAMGEGSNVASVSGTRLVGSGITIVTATETFVYEDIQITDPLGHPSTIALDVNDGANLMTNWELRNVYLTCSNTAKMGTGLRCVGALKGVVFGGAIEGWGIARDLQSVGGQKSNANAFYSVKVRANTYGLKTTDIDNVFLYGETSEGGLTGIKHESGTLHTFGVHYENNCGPKRQIHITGGILVSTGDEFYQSSTDLEVYVESGAGRHSLTAPVFNAGVKHNGTGLLTVVNPVNASMPTSGTGPVVRMDASGVVGVQNMTSLSFGVSGFLDLRPTVLTVTNGTDATTTTTVGGGGAAPTTTRSALVVLDAPHSGSFTGSANTRYRRAGTEIWNVGINSATVSGVHSAITDFYWFDAVGGAYAAALTTGGRLALKGAVAPAAITVTYSASMTIDASLGNIASITATNNTAFTINAPTNPTTGQSLLVRIRNTSGGALGVATWNAAFKMTAWAQPATGFSRAIDFDYDGVNWIESGRSAADVPN